MDEARPRQLAASLLLSAATRKGVLLHGHLLQRISQVLGFAFWPFLEVHVHRSRVCHHPRRQFSQGPFAPLVCIRRQLSRHGALQQPGLRPAPESESLHERNFVMPCHTWQTMKPMDDPNTTTGTLEEADEEILTYTVSDDAIEAAAKAAPVEWTRGQYQLTCGCVRQGYRAKLLMSEGTRGRVSTRAKWSSHMDEFSTPSDKLDQTDEDIFTPTVSDEAIEAAAGMVAGGLYPSWACSDRLFTLCGPGGC
jgi:hypothetical protein